MLIIFKKAIIGVECPVECPVVLCGVSCGVVWSVLWCCVECPVVLCGVSCGVVWSVLWCFVECPAFARQQVCFRRWPLISDVGSPSPLVQFWRLGACRAALAPVSHFQTVPRD